MTPAISSLHEQFDALSEGKYGDDVVAYRLTDTRTCVYILDLPDGSVIAWLRTWSNTSCVVTARVCYTPEEFPQLVALAVEASKEARTFRSKREAEKADIRSLLIELGFMEVLDPDRCMEGMRFARRSDGPYIEVFFPEQVTEDYILVEIQSCVLTAHRDHILAFVRRTAQYVEDVAGMIYDRPDHAT